MVVQAGRAQCGIRDAGWVLSPLLLLWVHCRVPGVGRALPPLVLLVPHGQCQAPRPRHVNCNAPVLFCSRSSTTTQPTRSRWGRRRSSGWWVLGRAAGLGWLHRAAQQQLVAGWFYCRLAGRSHGPKGAVAAIFRPPSLLPPCLAAGGGRQQQHGHTSRGLGGWRTLEVPCCAAGRVAGAARRVLQLDRSWLADPLPAPLIRGGGPQSVHSVDC